MNGACSSMRTIVIVDAHYCNAAPVDDVFSTGRSGGNHNQKADPTIHNDDLSSKPLGRREGKGGGHGGEIGEDKRGKRGWEMQRPLFEHSLVVVIISMTYWKWRRWPHVWSGGVA